MKQFELNVGTNHLDEENIQLTSLVEKPATNKLFAVFNEEGQSTEKVKENFKIMLPTRPNQQMVKPTDGKFERIISGVWFMPDTDYPRVRINEETGEEELYTASMNTDQLMLALKNFAQSGRMNDFNLMHNGELVEGLKTIEVWMVYNHYQYSPILLNSIEDLGYNVDDIPLGTVFMTVYIENEQFFNEMILSGKVKGFSVEGMFELTEKETIETTNMDKKYDSKEAEMFSSLGLFQQEGILITNNQEKLSFNKDSITLNDEKVINGSFKLSNAFSVEVREGKLVDFGFEEVSQAAGESAAVDTVTETNEISTETSVTEPNVLDEVKTTEDIKQVVEETTKQVEVNTETEVKDDTEVEVKVETETEPTGNEELLAVKNAEIEELKAQLEVEKKAKLEALKSQPIPKGNSGTSNLDMSKYRTVKVGGKERHIPII